MPNPFSKAFELFNIEKYFEAHEILEAEWQKMEDSDEKRWLQGLIQLIVVKHLLQENRHTGAHKVFLRAKTNLEDAPELYNGFQLKNLEAEIASTPEF